MILFPGCRGLLKGKYERGVKAPEGSRLAWSKSNKVDIDAAPDLERIFKDDDFWNLMDAMKKAAANHSEYIR